MPPAAPSPASCRARRTLLSSLPLQVLNVESNRLTQLPPEIGSLPRLERLLVGRNALTSLPASLGRLQQLTLLSCAGNKIGELPDELGDASALEEIDAADNYLKAGLLLAERLLRARHARASGAMAERCLGMRRRPRDSGLAVSELAHTLAPTNAAL